jgi:hypothetical protein
MVAVFLLFGGVAQAATTTSVALFSDPGDWPGGGEQRLFHAGNSQIGVTGNASYLTVNTNGTPGYYSLDFAAPPGQTLAPGIYDQAERAPFRSAGHPGIDIDGNGRGCNTIEGRFEVRDLVVGPGGVPERLWIIFEQHCEGGPEALFGEVRVQEPAPDAPISVAPAITRWPLADRGRPGTVVPVTLLSNAAAQIGSVSIVGSGADQFAIRLDECSSRALTAGGGCQVWLRFVPTRPGTHLATLRLVDSSGRAYDSGLQGFAYGGTTRVVMHSDPGDWVGDGRDWLYEPPDSIIFAHGNRSHVDFSVTGPAGDWWYADFEAPRDILAPGRYPNAARYPFNGTSPGLSVTGEGRGCNTVTGEFTITYASFDLNGGLLGVGIDFVQHCDGNAPAMRGSFDYRAHNTTAPAPWVVPPPTSPPPTGGSGGSPVGGTGPTGGRGTANPVAVPKAFLRGRGRCARPRSTRRAVVTGTDGADRLKAGPRAEVIFAGAGDDVVFGRGGADCVDGGAGDDVLSGGRGADRLYGGSGDDRLIGGRGRDLLACGSGRDVAQVSGSDRTRGCERVVHSKRR